MAPKSLESLSQPVYDEKFFADLERRQKLEQGLQDWQSSLTDARSSRLRRIIDVTVGINTVNIPLAFADVPHELRAEVGRVSLAGMAFVFGAIAFHKTIPWREQRHIQKIDRKYSLPELPRIDPYDPVGVGLIGPVEYDWPPREYGGVERDMVAVARGLGRAGIRSFAFGTATSTIADGSKFINLVPVVDESLANCPDKETYKLKEVQARERILKGVEFLIKQGQIDVIDVRWEDERLLQGLTKLAAKYNIPLLMHFSGTPNDHTRDTLAAFDLFGISTVHTTRWTTLSEAHRQGIRDHVVSHRTDALSRLPYGISFEDAPPPGAEPLATTSDRPTLPLLQELQDLGKNYIIHPGTIGPRKSQAKTIEAFRLAKSQGYLDDDTVFIIMGEPSPTREDALRYHQEFVLPYVEDKDIFYFGPANEAQKWELLRFAVASMFASGMEVDYVEAFCRLLAESTAVGTPVVGFDSPTFQEIIKMGLTGLGFGTVEEAARQLGRVKTVDRIACANYARENYSDQRMIEWILDAFRRLIKHRQKLLLKHH